MKSYLDNLSDIVNKIRNVRDIIITNTVLIGEKDAPTFKEKARADLFQERLTQFQVDECSADSYQNPLGIIRGITKDKPPIFVVAHLDTIASNPGYYNYTVRKNMIQGQGVEDNSIGVGVLMSLPRIFKELDLQFQSDIVLAGVIQSLGKGNLRGIRHLLKTWEGPIRGAVCIEGVELGRLNYYSEGMVRAEIECKTCLPAAVENANHINAILIVNEIINKILELRLPQKPLTKIVFGKINGGYHHGREAFEAGIGFEVKSDADDIVKELMDDIKEIVESLSRIYEIDLKLKIISNLSATGLKFNHPLVKAANAVMKQLNLEPKSESCESELSIFLSKSIPAVTLGVTHHKIHGNKTGVEIEPIFKGISQIIGVIQAIDNGVCDG
jgi:acetylornithine deacetylase/succinyl-diaminopimelate desuccinylase-like protein